MIELSNHGYKVLLMPVLNQQSSDHDLLALSPGSPSPASMRNISTGSKVILCMLAEEGETGNKANDLRAFRV